MFLLRALNHGLFFGFVDYVMLDIERQSDGVRSSTSPDTNSSSPDSINSETEELMRSARVDENGSPEIQPRRIVVSPHSAQARQRTNSKGRKDSEQDANENVDGESFPQVSKWEVCQ